MVGDPGVLGAVLAFQLALGLRVVGAAVDELHAGGADLAFEEDHGAVQPAGERGAVVRQQLAGQAVGSHRAAKRLPGQRSGQARPGHGGQQEPGPVVEDVHHPELAAVDQPMLGAVDLPQVVAERPLEPLPAVAAGPRPRHDQPPPDQDLMHGRHRRHRQPLTGQMSPDLLRAPAAQPFLVQPHDLVLDVRRRDRRTVQWPPRPRHQPVRALRPVPAQPLIHLRLGRPEALPPPAVPTADPTRSPSRPEAVDPRHPSPSAAWPQQGTTALRCPGCPRYGVSGISPERTPPDLGASRPRS